MIQWHSNAQQLIENYQNRIRNLQFFFGCWLKSGEGSCVWWFPFHLTFLYSFVFECNFQYLHFCIADFIYSMSSCLLHLFSSIEGQWLRNFLQIDDVNVTKRLIVWRCWYEINSRTSAFKKLMSQTVLSFPYNISKNMQTDNDYQ